MTPSIIFRDTFQVAGIMCLHECGATIQSFLHFCIEECINEGHLPEDAKIIIDAEPNGLGIHRFFLSIESSTEDFELTDSVRTIISAKLKESICGYEVLEEQEGNQTEQPKKINWVNILINLIAIGIIVLLSFIFPPSIFLTVGLALISISVSAFTARDYLINFFRNLRHNNLANMSSTISFGWFLSTAHTLFHAITMPLASSLSMIFMSFIMPLMLITFINGMDEIKRLILNKTKKMQLKGLKTIFPEMSETYCCYPLTQENRAILQQNMAIFLKHKQGISTEDDSDSLDFTDFEVHQSIQECLTVITPNEEDKRVLNIGMLITVNPGECFPVDCILVQGNTIIDASLLNGETELSKQLGQDIPAGAINLGRAVTVYATDNTYNSTVNRLLFRSNRKRELTSSESTPKFHYFYTALIILGIIAAIVAPAVLGIITLPLILQNVLGILFSVCPCTIALAHQLPRLISIHHRGNKGIQVREENLSGGTEAIETIVFDKTGTLTTNNSTVESTAPQLPSSLWECIYLLEKAHGNNHPLAKAVVNYYVAHHSTDILFTEVKEEQLDPKHRGLSAKVQAKMIHLGNAAYFENAGIAIPSINQAKIEQGYSPIYVAEDNLYQGVIYIKHEPRKGLIEALSRLKQEGKRIIMLTGDNVLAAKGFNKQNHSLFAEEDIHAGQTPQQKEDFLKQLMTDSTSDPRSVWFVGDGLNDAPCCRIISDKGGISCAMNHSDKSAFFTDLSLNGSFDYLFQHHDLNRFLKQNILQNKGILVFSTLAFLAFIIGFSVASIAVSPLIPMAIMLSTTLFVLFNSYRTQLAVDSALDKVVSWPKKLMASNLSISLLLAASALLICSILIATVATGGLALPALVFTAGVITVLSSACTLASTLLFSAFACLATAYLLSKFFFDTQDNDPVDQTESQPIHFDEPRSSTHCEENPHDFNFFLNRSCREVNEQIVSTQEDIEISTYSM